MYSVDDFIRRAATQLEAYNSQRTNLQKLISENEQRKTELKQRIATAYANITATVLPTLTEEGLANLSAAINAPRIARLWSEMQKREQQLQHEIQDIEADDEYKKSSALTTPHTGVLTSQIEELEPILAKLKSELDMMNSMPRMQRLVASGYGTERYPHKGFFKFLNSEYLEDWKNADIIQEKLNAKSFIDVASRYSEVNHQVDTFSESLADLRRQLQRVLSKVKEHDSDVHELQHLPEYISQEAGKEIALFLQSGKEAAAKKLPQGEEALKLYAVLDGMNHQVEYLEQLNLKITNDINDLNQRADKLRDEKARYEDDRYRFRNKQFTDEQFAHRFGNDRYDRAYNRYDRMGDTIYVFNDYYRYSPLEEFLWWDVMTDGRLDGNFIPEVQSYYHEHPGYTYERDTTYNDSDSSSSGWSDVS
ncbi:MAG: hypothetical protein JNJ85_12960 [Candidatus Kapabacteria bacterium]|nr:hypothetical protein [Candidatus Kapabacteria bacterium]